MAAKWSRHSTLLERKTGKLRKSRAGRWGSCVPWPLLRHTFEEDILGPLSIVYQASLKIRATLRSVAKLASLHKRKLATWHSLECMLHITCLFVKIPKSSLPLLFLGTVLSLSGRRWWKASAHRLCSGLHSKSLGIPSAEVMVQELPHGEVNKEKAWRVRLVTLLSLVRHVGQLARLKRCAHPQLWLAV